MDVRRVVGYTQIALMLVMLAACSFLFPEKYGNFKPRSESIFGSSQAEVCKMAMSDADAEAEASDAVINDPEAQKLNDILSSLGLSLDLNSTSGCMVDEEVISDDGDGGGTSSASIGVFGQQVTPEITYTTTPAGSNGNLHIVEGVNEENNLWLSWQQDSANNQRRMITHIELFGDNSALDAALAQNMALGVRFTSLEDYNKRRLVHQLAQFTTLGQGATYASAQSADGINYVESLQFGGQLLDVKNAQAVIVNEKVDPNNAAQLYGEALIVLPLISNSRSGSGVNFELDDALYLRIPVVADSTEPLWNVAFVGSDLPDPLNEPSISTNIPIVNLPADDFGFQINPLLDGSGGWRTGRFQIYVKGHPDWTTDHDYHIVLGVQSGTGGTGTFSNVIHGTIGSTSTSTIITASGGIPHMEGTVQNEGVYYTVYVENAKGIKFEFQMDTDGDGAKEKYGSLPVFFKETNGNYYDVTQMPGDNRKFGLRTSSDVHALPFSNMQLCAVDLTSCGTASVYVPDTGGTSTTVFDPDILDYWSTPLVVPQDFDLATDAINDVSRDNFYKNYTTERVDVLDIRAFSRWGYDFENAFDYCPYAYYDELMPFKRALCENYFDVWYQKQWEKEDAILASMLSVHNSLVSSDVYNALISTSATRDLNMVFAGLDEELDLQSYETLLDSVDSIESASLRAASVFGQQAIPNADALALSDLQFALIDNTVGENKINSRFQYNDVCSGLQRAEENYDELRDFYLNQPEYQVEEFYKILIAQYGLPETYDEARDDLDDTEEEELLAFFQAIREKFLEMCSFVNDFRFIDNSTSHGFGEIGSEVLSIMFSILLGYSLETIDNAANCCLTNDGVSIYNIMFGSGQLAPEEILGNFAASLERLRLSTDLGSSSGAEKIPEKISDAILAHISETLVLLLNDAVLPTREPTNTEFNEERPCSGDADPYVCELTRFFANTMEIGQFIDWIATPEAGIESRSLIDRSAEGLGTMKIIANSLLEGFTFLGFETKDQFFFESGTGGEQSEWWAASFRIPADFDTKVNFGIGNNPTIKLEESILLLARGDDCDLNFGTPESDIPGAPYCGETYFEDKFEEIAAWVVEAVFGFFDVSGGTDCPVKLASDESVCAQDALVTVALTSSENNTLAPHLNSEALTGLMETIQDAIDQVQGSSGTQQIPIIGSILGDSGDEDAVIAKCEPVQLCKAQGYLDPDGNPTEKLDLIVCGQHNLPPGCTRTNWAALRNTTFAFQYPEGEAKFSTPPPYCALFLSSQECNNPGEFFTP